MPVATRIQAVVFGLRKNVNKAPQGHTQAVSISGICNLTVRFCRCFHHLFWFQPWQQRKTEERLSDAKWSTDGVRKARGCSEKMTEWDESRVCVIEKGVQRPRFRPLCLESSPLRRSECFWGFCHLRGLCRKPTPIVVSTPGSQDRSVTDMRSSS